MARYGKMASTTMMVEPLAKKRSPSSFIMQICSTNRLLHADRTCHVLSNNCQVQEILLQGVDDTQPELARILSLGVMVHLAASSKNCHSLLHNEQAWGDNK